MDLWRHQTYGIQATLAARDDGCKRIALTSPTGGGKSRIIQEVAAAVLAEGKNVALYTNRILMVEQLSAGLAAAGMMHGIRAAGQEELEEHPFQVCSFQTETSRVLKRKSMKLHACGPGDLAVIDECHLHTSDKAQQIFLQHINGGAAVLGVTATPLGIGDLYDRLIVAGRPSELRECGALVPAVHYGCDEPDVKAFKKLREGQDPSATDQRKAMMTPSIMARVWKWYQKLNPTGKPALLFGPDVQGSLWFAEQFTAHGVRAAHLDGDDVWLDGQFYASDPGMRKRIREESQAGTLKVVCNRFVLREGVDWPWIEHIILACIMGSLQTILQCVGRGLRASTGKTELIVQDHGGAWHRHGSVNEDREWHLDYTTEIVAGLRADRLRAKKSKEPFLCPGCGRVWGGGSLCNPARGGCGHVLDSTRKSRPVVSTDGEMKELTGDVFKPRRISRDTRGPAIWERMYFRSKTDKGARTFRAAAALFAYENNHGWPDPQWPLMPREPIDWFRLVANVPRERLT